MAPLFANLAFSYPGRPELKVWAFTRQGTWEGFGLYGGWMERPGRSSV